MQRKQSRHGRRQVDRRTHRRQSLAIQQAMEAVEPRILFAFPPMTAVSGAGNPLSGFDVGILSHVTLGDLDNDGDLDAVVGEGNSGALLYFKNTGSGINPVYTQQTGGANPFNGVDLGTHSTPTLGDINGDSRLDLVAGAEDGTIHYFRNVGGSTSPAFAEQTGGANPWNGIDLGNDSVPTLGDVDGDGDPDALFGNFDGVLRYFRNFGTSTAPVYVEQFAGANPWNGIDVDFLSKPTLADVDGDGDIDTLVGTSDGAIRYFRNNGTATSSSYAELTGTANPFNGFSTVSNAAPATGDVNGDGDLDFFAGALDGTFRSLRNDALTDVAKYAPVTGATNPFDGMDIGSYSRPVLQDVDQDGDRDLVVGTLDGTLQYFKNTGTSTSAVYVQQTGAANPFAAIDVGTFAAPAFGSMDGTAGTDLVVGAGDGRLYFFTTSGGVLVERTGIDNPFNGIDVGSLSTPTVGDVNGDLISLRDLLVGAQDGTIHYIRNDGPGVAPVYVHETGAANPWGTIDVGDFSAPALADLDGDGDFDFVIGAHDSPLRYFKNAGSRSGPFPVQQTGDNNPFNGMSVGFDAFVSFGEVDGDGDLDAVVGCDDGTVRYFRNDSRAPRTLNYNQSGSIGGVWVMSPAKPALADLDGDGDLDIISGEPVGTVKYFKNVGTSTAPVYQEQSGGYVAQTNTGNPFNGFDIGAQAAPTFGDLDADGDLDVIVGEDNGGLQFWRNNGTAKNPAFQVFGVNAEVGDLSTPTMGDIDGDGDLDFVVGAADGSLHYFKNVGTASSPSHVEQGGGYNPQTNTGNPFNGADVGVQSAPTLGDVDGDGDLDLLVGRGGDTMAYFKNVGSATVPSFSGQASPFGSITVGAPNAPALGDLDRDGDLDAVVEGDVGVLYFYPANRGPVVDNAIADQTFAGAGVLSYVVPADTFLDLDKDSMTYSATRVGGGALPAWLSFNAATRTFSGNPSPADTSPIQIRVVANDGVGGTGFDDFQLTLGNVADNSLVVTTAADENNGNSDPLAGTGTSLREAINYAQTLSSFQLITFAASLTSGGPATISLAQGELAITGGSFRIQGPGANLLTITANNNSRVFNISGGGTIELTAMTITGGAANIGAGILNSATNLNMVGVTIANNVASAFGGGIASPNGGTLNIFTSSIINNTAGNEGGGIESQGITGSPATLLLTNCTIAGNTANGSGFGGAISNVASGGAATVDIRDCTIANNSGANGAGILNAVNSGSAAVSYIGTLLANNGANVVSFGGTVTSLGYNLSSDNTGGLAATGDLPNTNPVLGPLGMNGGATPTIPLLPNSPAINAGVEIPGITRDQRAVLRPQGSAPDIGAYERETTTAQITQQAYEWESRQAIVFTFNNEASVPFSRADITVRNSTTNQTITGGALSFNSAGTQATLLLTNLLPNGQYEVTTTAAFGAPMLPFFVLAGDADHNGTINFDDYARIDLGFNTGRTGFSNGDFNYDGVINFDDYAIIDLAFNQQDASLPAIGDGSGKRARGGLR